MNLRALRTLIEIERVGSFAVAAERLGITLSTVSAQMKTLEEELAFPLFDRRHRPPAMTPAARQTAAHARRMLAEAEAVRALGDQPGVLKGVIRIGFVGTASVRLLPGFLLAAATRQPAARFAVESGVSTDLVARLAAGELEAAVVTESPDMPRGILTRRLRREAFALAAPAGAEGWPLARCCAALPFIRFLPSTGIGLLVDGYLTRHAGPVGETVTLDSVEAVMGCVNAGIGFGVLPEADARRYAAGASVTVLDEPPLERLLCLAVQAGAAGARHVDSLAPLFAGPEA
ncbi:MAG: LysR family transcriptional regulator [Pseudomonadota bacterium]